MAAQEDEARMRMNYEAAIYREQLVLLRREIERISLTTLDLANAASAVEGLKPQRVLVPVGGGVFAKSEIKDTRVIVPVGSEFAIEMERPEAAIELNKRAEATKQAVMRLNEEFEKINRKLRDVMMKLQEAETNAKISQQVEAGVKEDYI